MFMFCFIKKKYLYPNIEELYQKTYEEIDFKK